MKLITVGVLAALCVATFGQENHEHDKFVCYCNTTSFQSQALGEFQIDHLRPALSFCTHLVYGYVGINAETLEATAINPHLDTDAGYTFFRAIPQLKWTFPDLKIYLSIGRYRDPYQETPEYLVVTETTEARAKFVNSLGLLLTDYQFDGIDLAWHFPEVEAKKNRTSFGNLWHGLKKTLTQGNNDEKEAEHRDGFAILVRDIKDMLRSRHNNNKALTLTVLPHINASIYYDVRSLVPNLDAVHLFAFDQKTPDRNPKEADYSAPIYESYGRVRQENIDYEVRFWLERGTPGSKIILGIPTYARTWTLTGNSQDSGIPPITVDGPGAAGPYTRIPGFLSYTEVCTRLTKSAIGHLRHVKDPSKKYGSYAYQNYDDQNEADGIWISYEEPATAGNKAAYVRAKGLGGVAIVDLSLDDFRGVCNGDKYPILRAAKSRL